MSGLVYADVCAGISAATVAWHPLGWKTAFYAEVEKFPSAVLRHHYPDTPNLGDMTAYERWPDARINVLIGGTPCQGFSIAGLRKGLDDPRSNLALCFGRIAQRFKPRWLLWENVPGARSLNGGRDLGAFLRGLAELGYGLAWRSFDAQYAGLAQRRERLFVVGHLGDWRPAAAVLFEPEGLRWNPAPRREARQGIAPTIAGGARSSGGYSHDDLPLTIDLAHSLRADGFDASEDGTGRGTPIIAFVTTQITSKTNRCQPAVGDPCHPLAASAHAPAIAFDCKVWRGHEFQCWGVTRLVKAIAACPPPLPSPRRAVSKNARGFAWESDVHATLQARAESGGSNTVSGVLQGWAVRRLTPRECERLMGFPDDFTRIPWRGKPAELCPDRPRYKALGNSISVPDLRWIGQRITLCDSIIADDVRRAA